MNAVVLEELGVNGRERGSRSVIDVRARRWASGLSSVVAGLWSSQ